MVAIGSVVRVGREWDLEALGVAPVDFDPRTRSDGRDAADAHGTDAGAGGTFRCQGQLFGPQAEDRWGGRRCGLGREVDEVPGSIRGGATPDWRVAGEVGEPGRAGLAVEFEGTTGLQHAATFDDGEVVGSRDEIGRVMGDVEEREVEFPLEVAEESAQVASQGGIEVGEGFVEEDEARLKDQGAADGGACGFAAGECGGEVMEARAEVEAVRHDLGAGATLVAVDALEAEGKFELFDQRKVGKEPGRLGDPAAGAFLGRKSGDVGVVEEDPSDIREIEAGDESEGGGLATAGGAHEEVMGAGGDVDGEVLHRMNGTEVFADFLESDARHDGERFKISDSSFTLEGAASPRCLS